MLLETGKCKFYRHLCLVGASYWVSAQQRKTAAEEAGIGIELSQQVIRAGDHLGDKGIHPIIGCLPCPLRVFIGNKPHSSYAMLAALLPGSSLKISPQSNLTLCLQEAWPDACWRIQEPRALPASLRPQHALRVLLSSITLIPTNLNPLSQWTRAADVFMSRILSRYFN